MRLALLRDLTRQTAGLEVATGLGGLAVAAVGAPLVMNGWSHDEHAVTAIVASASSGVALRPVPIAQIGSYAMTSSRPCPWRPRERRLDLAEHLGVGGTGFGSSRVSPTQTIGIISLASTAFTLRLHASSVSPNSSRRSE